MRALVDFYVTQMKIAVMEQFQYRRSVGGTLESGVRQIQPAQIVRRRGRRRERRPDDEL